MTLMDDPRGRLFLAAAAGHEVRRGAGRQSAVPQLSPRREHPGVETITLGRLAELISERQRAEEHNPGIHHEPLITWVEIAHDEDREQALALMEMARAYHIESGWRHLPPALA